MRKVLVIVNPRAGGGKALSRWHRIESEILRKIGPFDLHMADDGCLDDHIAGKLREGEREFVAAGGDGTVNYLLNTLVSTAADEILPEVRLGAIGLGSSNDFHKPFGDHTQIKGIPCRIDFGAAQRHDVGEVTYENGERKLRSTHWIINSSVGVTAEANRLFNQPDSVLNFLKRTSTGLAIVYAALRTLTRYRAKDAIIEIDGMPRHASIENLAAIKNPHFSGNFCYATPLEADNGYFFVHLMERKSLPGKLKALWRLSRSGAVKEHLTRCWRAQELGITAKTPFAVEYDGEVITARCAVFTLRQGLIRVCN